MSKIVLVHGFASDITSPFSQPEPDHSGFRAFAPLVEKEEAVSFRWAIPHTLGLIDSVSLPAFLKVYQKEKVKAGELETLQSFKSFLDRKQPGFIVAHSLGCELVLNTLEKFPLPASVKRITFVQGDFNYDRGLPNNFDETVEYLQLYAPWDYTLAFSSLYNRKARAGLVGWKTKNVKNQLFLSYKHPHLHVSPMRDSNLLQVCLD